MNEQAERRPPLPVRIRRARRSDRAAVMAFASRTPDGWDYLPHAWPEWVDAPDGVLIVALPARPSPGAPPELAADGRPLDPDVPIAVSRFALMSATEGWVEGIRVDPRVRGRAVATQLQIAELAWAAAHDIHVVRYVTDDDNEASHRLGARHGFRVVGRLRAYVAEDDDDDPPFESDEQDRRTLAAATARRQRALDELARLGLRVAPDAGDAVVDQLWDAIDRDPSFGQANRMYESRPWTFQELTRDRFEAHLRRGDVVAEVGSDGGPLAVAILEHEAVTADDPTIHLGVLAGRPEASIRLAGTIRRHVGAALRVRLPDPDPPLVGGNAGAWRDAGFPPRSYVTHLLERRVAAGTPVPEPDAPHLLEFEDRPARIAAPVEL